MPTLDEFAESAEWDEDGPVVRGVFYVRDYREPAIAEISADLDERLAYIENALSHLRELRLTVNGGLTGASDLFLKVGLLQDADAIESNLRKALA